MCLPVTVYLLVLTLLGKVSGLLWVIVFVELSVLSIDRLIDWWMEVLGVQCPPRYWPPVL